MFCPKGIDGYDLLVAGPVHEMSEKVDITLTINGRDHAIRVEPRKTLVDAIREDCGQTGTHIGCEHGICGTCTVILDDEAVRACLAHHGLQCGFCTPGFLMLAANALEQNPDIDDEAMLDILSSNLCRCTGYQNIIKAVRAAAAEMRGQRAEG